MNERHILCKAKCFLLVLTLDLYLFPTSNLETKAIVVTILIITEPAWT